MPLVTVEIWEGRSVNEKRKLVKAVTKAVADSIKCPEGAVTVIIRDLPKCNWGMGGELASDKVK